MSLKPLGKVRELVEAAGMAISYAYDDLVFLDHNAFLLQFDEDGRTVFIHTNSEADIGETSEGVSRLQKTAKTANDIVMVDGLFYTLIQLEDNSISIEFHEHC
jgi:hypothetical protein